MADHPLAVAVTVSDDLRKAHAEFLPEGLRQNGLTNRTGDRVLTGRARAIPRPERTHEGTADSAAAKGPDSRSESGLRDDIGTAYRTPDGSPHPSQPRSETPTKRRMRRKKQRP